MPVLKRNRGRRLYYAKARWYNPEVGMFTTVDPVKDGVNWYAYTANNPMGFVDPLGLRMSTGYGVSEETKMLDMSPKAQWERDRNRRRKEFYANYTPDPSEQEESVANDGLTGNEIVDKYKDDANFDLLKELFFYYEIYKLPKKAQEKFVELFVGSIGDEYAPCTAYLKNSFKETHDINIIAEIRKMEGTNMAEKAKKYADKTGKIQIIEDEALAQRLANKGEDIGIIGHYFDDDNTERYIHYGKVAPCAISYAESGTQLKYKTKGAIVILEVKDNPNNPHSRWGPLVSNKGAANGLVAFSWAFNSNPAGFQIRDTNIVGGIVFFRMVPEQPKPIINEQYHYSNGGFIIRPERER